MASVMWAVMACMNKCHSEENWSHQTTIRVHINMLKGTNTLKLLARLHKLCDFMDLACSTAEKKFHFIYTLEFHANMSGTLGKAKALSCIDPRECSTVTVLHSLVCTPGTVTHWHFCELLAPHRDKRTNLIIPSFHNATSPLL